MRKGLRLHQNNVSPIHKQRSKKSAFQIKAKFFKWTTAITIEKTKCHLTKKGAFSYDFSETLSNKNCSMKNVLTAEGINTVLMLILRTWYILFLALRLCSYAIGKVSGKTGGNIIPRFSCLYLVIMLIITSCTNILYGSIKIR